MDQARFCLASKLGAIEVLVDGTEAGACRKLIGALKSDMGSILNAMIGFGSDMPDCSPP